MIKLKSVFNIPDIEYLEDLSGKEFYPFPDTSFPLSISTEVYVRQLLPNKVPTVIYPTESKFVFDTGTWGTWATKIQFAMLSM